MEAHEFVAPRLHIHISNFNAYEDKLCQAWPRSDSEFRRALEWENRFVFTFTPALKSSSTFPIEYHLLWQRRQEARNSEKVGWYFESLILSFNACQKTGTNQGISLLFPMQYFAAHRCLFNAAATSILLVPILFFERIIQGRQGGEQNGEHQYVDVSIRVNTHLLNM